MSNVRIVAEDGVESTVTLLTLSRRVPDDQFFDILSDLVQTRKATVTLSDGRRADVFLLRPEDGFHPLSEQSALPLRDYQATAQLMFEIPGVVRVRAASEAEAQAIITNVVRNHRKPPEGFAIGLDGDAIDSFTIKLEAALADSHRNRTLGVRDIEFTSPLTERRLLGGPSS